MISGVRYCIQFYSAVCVDSHGPMISLQMVEILYFLQGFTNCQLLGLLIGAPLRQFLLQLKCQVFVNKYRNSRVYATCAFAAVRVDLNHITDTLLEREQTHRVTLPDNWHSSLPHHRTLGTRHPLPPHGTHVLHQIIYDYLILYTHIYCKDARDLDIIVFCFVCFLVF